MRDGGIKRRVSTSIWPSFPSVTMMRKSQFILRRKAKQAVLHSDSVCLQALIQAGLLLWLLSTFNLLSELDVSHRLMVVRLDESVVLTELQAQTD